MLAKADTASARRFWNGWRHRVRLDADHYVPKFGPNE
jgi:hypothetical protein